MLLKSSSSAALVVLLLATVSQAFVCPPDFCSGYECDAVGSCENGRVAEKGGVCGCCDICIRQIGEGENCDLTLLLGYQPTHECQTGLKCDRTRVLCVRDEMAGPCHKELYNANNGPKLLGKFIPSCEINGLYSSVQCHGSECFCVQSNGNKIEGYNTPIGDRSKKTCKCAREQADYRATGMLGKMFHCDQHGNFEPVQCLGSVCFCADSEGKALLGVAKKHITKKHELSCPQ